MNDDTDKVIKIDADDVRTSEEKVAEALRTVLGDLPSVGAKRAYDTDWNRFSEWLAGQRIDPLEVTPKVVGAYVRWARDDRKLARATIGKSVSVLRQVYGQLVNDEVMSVNPAREIKTPKMDHSLRTPVLTEEQVRALFAAQPNETWKQQRDLLVLRSMIGLGWRRAEIARMRGDDFDGNVVTAIVKGNKRIAVAAPAWLREELDEWRGGNPGPVFPRAPGSNHEISGNIVWEIVDKARKRTGLPRGSVTPHAFRRTYITLAGQKGVSLRARQLSVGHTSASTTERYDHARDARATAVGDVFADIASGGR